jgi:hypothetical protein
MITFCLISCERPDLLEITLDSFFKFNTAPIEKYVIGEDSPIRMPELEKKFPMIEFHYNDTGKRYGMMRNLQKAYSFAETEYIFSCEDDWEFYRDGFIEKSLPILQSESSILQVWLRELNDTNGHPIEKEAINIGGVNCHLVTTGYMGCFHGYSTNPSLKRKCDVVDFDKIIEGCKNNGEDKVSQYYFDKGFRSVILPDGFVRHIGENRTVC